MKMSTDSLADQAYSIVEQMIISLDLRPGSVFSEAQLSERIGIGRTPLREALKQLAHERLIAVLPRRGMMVTEINVVEYLAVLETRRVLDRLIAESATRRATPEHRHRLLGCASSMEQAAASGDTQSFLRLDFECDDILADAARNTFATQAVAALHSHCRRFWTMHRHKGDLSESSRLHVRLLRAVAGRGKDNEMEANEMEAGAASDALVEYLQHFTRETLELL